MERIMSEQDKEKFVNDVIDYIVKRQWSISNVHEAFDKVVKHMEKNAVLIEEVEGDQKKISKNCHCPYPIEWPPKFSWQK